ncbi:Transcriptional regulator, MarR family [Caballeronia sordidicola]|uniref:Transcriptional regulator, MarR family n=2 Tax=Caballeronia sordidicola TaxID=196367 RepID=A0A242MDG1_CABSO|nr:Transcriptional regulator, MarR family [Caballeronia sordidicola]
MNWFCINQYIQAALNQRDELLDIDLDDLESLMRDTQMLAYARSFRDLACADIMSSPVLTVVASAPATSARDLLKRHDVKALPVIDDADWVIGIATRSDLMDKYSAATAFDMSEQAAQSKGVTPLQYLLLLHIKGYPEREWATIGELAQRLQAQHHGVVALVSRCEALKLVKRKASETDRRQVEVHLLKTSEKLLARLAELHRAELRSLTSSFRVPQIDL